MSSSDENGTKEPTNERQELSVNGPGQKNSDKTSNELPNVKGDDKNDHSRPVKREQHHKQNHHNGKHNNPKRKKDHHDINHNRDNRNRYREPDFEFEGIISTEGVLEMMQEGYGFEIFGLQLPLLTRRCVCLPITNQVIRTQNRRYSIRYSSSS